MKKSFLLLFAIFVMSAGNAQSYIGMSTTVSFLNNNVGIGSYTKINKESVEIDNPVSDPIYSYGLQYEYSKKRFSVSTALMYSSYNAIFSSDGYINGILINESYKVSSVYIPFTFSPKFGMFKLNLGGMLSDTKFKDCIWFDDHFNIDVLVGVGFSVGKKVKFSADINYVQSLSPEKEKYFHTGIQGKIGIGILL